MIIAAHIDGAVDVDRELAALDELAGRGAGPNIDALVELLFGRLGLRGDQHTYDDPLNSCLPRVLDRRLGIPISLSVLAMEVGRRVGVDLEGVGMPGHFLVRVVGAPDGLIDPFAAGRRLDVDDCRRLYSALHGPEDQFSPEMLAPTSKAAIVSRMLANLTNSYTRGNDLAGRRWVASLRAALPGRPPAERMAVAAELAATGAFAAAATVIDETADRLADRPGPSTDRLRAHARGVRARLN